MGQSEICNGSPSPRFCYAFVIQEVLALSASTIFLLLCFARASFLFFHKHCLYTFTNMLKSISIALACVLAAQVAAHDLHHSHVNHLSLGKRASWLENSGSLEKRAAKKCTRHSQCSGRPRPKFSSAVCQADGACAYKCLQGYLGSKCSPCTKSKLVSNLSVSMLKSSMSVQTRNVSKLV